jgi:hypothetical protein
VGLLTVTAVGAALTVGQLSAGAADITIGSGPDTLVLRVSEDAYQGDAEFTVEVDGEQIGDTLTATADHGAGASDTVTVAGDWAPGEHRLRVTFRNDLWEGGADTDRNLYLDGVAYDGVDVPDSAREMFGWNATGEVTFTDGAVPPPAEPAFVETFDDGVGALSHTWGDTSKIDISVPGQVTVSGTAGFMEWPSGPEQGHGYGLFEMRAKMAGNVPGPALVLWPADDRWPGQEFDLGEVLEDGRPYLTTHWADENGEDAFNPHIVDRLDESDWHTYAVRWEPGKLTYYVDGVVVGEDTEHVPADFAHGGKNDVFGAMNRPGDNTSLTLTEVRWTPLG